MNLPTRAVLIAEGVFAIWWLVVGIAIGASATALAIVFALFVPGTAISLVLGAWMTRRITKDKENG
jgi:membrane protein implicated in regulation of membrane protease activity